MPLDIAAHRHRIQEAHPLKQGLKLSIVRKRVSMPGNSRGASIKTRIETRAEIPPSFQVLNSRGASIKTRIETIVYQVEKL